MSYESAPATQLLATHCAICRRPLLDATSVERGIGPDCAEKHGFNTEVDPQSREVANAIVHAIACAGAPTTPESAARFSDQLVELANLGFSQLASILADRNVAIRIREENGALTCESPYTESFPWEIKHACPGARWDRDSKRWSVRPDQRGGLWSAIKRVYPRGTLGVGPKGTFVV